MVWQRVQRCAARSQAAETSAGKGGRPAVSGFSGVTLRPPAPQLTAATTAARAVKRRSVVMGALRDPVADELQLRVVEEGRPVERHARPEGRRRAELLDEHAG